MRRAGDITDTLIHHNNVGPAFNRRPIIVSTLGQCLMFVVVTVHAVDSVLTRTTCDNHCARSVRPYTIHLPAKAYPALALVAVMCGFTASVAAAIKAYR